MSPEAERAVGALVFVSGDACLYGLRLCYPFSAISIGKLLYVYIIYTAIACTVVYYLDAVCCEV